MLSGELGRYIHVRSLKVKEDRHLRYARFVT